MKSVVAVLCATLVLAMATRAGARLPSCPRACHTLQVNCLGFARQTLADTVGACTGTTHRTGVRAARQTFRSDRTGCSNRYAASIYNPGAACVADAPDRARPRAGWDGGRTLPTRRIRR